MRKGRSGDGGSKGRSHGSQGSDGPSFDEEKKSMKDFCASMSQTMRHESSVTRAVLSVCAAAVGWWETGGRSEGTGEGRLAVSGLGVR